MQDAIKLKVVVDLVALEALGNWRQVQEESSEEDLSAEPQPEPSAAGSHDSDSSDQPDPNVRQADITPGDGSDKSWSSNSSDRQDMLTQPAFIHPSSAQASAASSASDASEPVPESSSARAQLTSEPGVWPSSAQAADAEAGRLQGSLHIAENAQPELQGVARASSSQARAPRTQAQAPQAGAAQQQLSITRRQALSNFWAVIDGYPERRLVPRATNAAVPLDRVFEEEEM